MKNIAFTPPLIPRSDAAMSDILGSKTNKSTVSQIKIHRERLAMLIDLSLKRRYVLDAAKMIKMRMNILKIIGVF